MRLLLSKALFGLYMGWHTVLYLLKRNIKVSLLFVVFISFIVIWRLLFPPFVLPESFSDKQATVLIPKGASMREIAGILQENEVLHNKEIFVFLGKLSGYQDRIQAGLFDIPKDMHPWHLLKYLLQPKLSEIKVTIPEGVATSEMASIFQQQLDIDSLHFMQLVSDSLFCHSFGINTGHLEGYLLPETYFFTYGMKEEDIIEFLVDKTLAIFKPDSIVMQLSQLNMSLHQILTLASIVEGEVVVDSERVLVSSVYHNRLKRRWHLAADPTIQYIIPGPPRRLLNRDLEIDSPYNTYKYRGLPPGPINNPGKNSILAAIFPGESRYLYFVATGDGGHHFSRTAAEHARWKAKFNRIRREVRRNNRYQ